MAIKKSGLEETLTAEQKAEVEAIEQYIDAELKKHYTGREGVYITLHSYPADKIRKELKRRYKEAGWKMQFGDDQRDGASVKVT